MALETGTYVSDLVDSNPAGSDAKAQGDDHIRLIKDVLGNTFPDADKPFRFPKAEAVSADETVVAADQGTVYSMDASGGEKDINLPSGLAAADEGWKIAVVKSDSSTNGVVIDPAAADTINGKTTIKLTGQYQWVIVVWTGTAWVGLFGPRREAAEESLASAATTDLSSISSSNVLITGTTTITAFGTEPAGVTKWLRFAGALTLTHNATSLILPGGADITTAAGDMALMKSEGSGKWRCYAYVRADGTALAVNFASEAEAAARTNTTKAISPKVNPFPPGHKRGLAISAGADADHDLTIETGSARDATDAVNLILGSALTKRGDEAWAVGNDAGALDVGSSLAADTWYYVWLIIRSDTGVVDVLFSTSATAPTMPTDYDYKRLIDARLTDGSGNFIDMSSYGDERLWKTVRSSYDASPGTNAVLVTLDDVPTGIRTTALLAVAYTGASGNHWLLVTSPDQDDVEPSDSLFSIRKETSSHMRVRTDDQGRVRIHVTQNDRVRIVTHGFFMDFGVI